MSLTHITLLNFLSCIALFSTGHGQPGPDPETVQFSTFTGTFNPFEGVAGLGDGATNMDVDVSGPKKTGSSGKSLPRHFFVVVECLILTSRFLSLC